MYRPNFIDWLSSISTIMTAQFNTLVDRQEYPFYQALSCPDGIDPDDIDGIIEYTRENDSDEFEKLGMFDFMDADGEVKEYYVTDICSLGISVLNTQDWDDDDLLTWLDLANIDQKAHLLRQMEVYDIQNNRI